MHLKRISIENFRGLEKIEIEFDSLVNVIIGPNAIGKTTVLEAIRLSKGVLAPRTPNESTQVLQALGALSPHMNQRLFPLALTSKPNFPTSIKTRYGVEPGDMQRIRSLSAQLALSLAQQNAGLTFAPPNQVMAYLSSPAGQASLSVATNQLNSEIAQIEQNKILNLNLTIQSQIGRLQGEFPIQQIIFAALDQALGPGKTYFSYFPADRALPTGEQPVQLGLADSNIQLESYNSQPQLKYNRLKNSIFNSIIGAEKGRNELNEQFNLIFKRILKGRTLGEIGVNDIGMLSIPIIDSDSGAQFEIDGLSSGEKGLILTFLLIAVSIEQNGLILLDEPELHLNPAVCRDLLQFFVDEYASKKNIQAIICTHSAELLAGSFERPSCSLFHLKGNNSCAKVRQNDTGEIRDALRRLGSSESEALLYKGTISVEGIHDIEILESGYDDILRRYKIRQRGGRHEVEKAIEELQKSETNGDEIGNHYFIFDRDRKPTSLKNSEHVKLVQLEKYCLENYLLDVEILTDLSRSRDFSENPKNNTTSMRDVMKRLAFAQLQELIAREIFCELDLEKVAFSMEVMRAIDVSNVASGLQTQVQAMVTRLQTLNNDQFQSTFISLFNNRKTLLEQEWDEKWRDLCNGKRLLEDMRKDGHFKGDLLRLKKAVISEMRNRKTDAYVLLETLVRSVL